LAGNVRGQLQILGEDATPSARITARSRVFWSSRNIAGPTVVRETLAGFGRKFEAGLGQIRG